MKRIGTKFGMPDRPKTFQFKLDPAFREELEAAAERDGFKQGQLGTWMKWVLARHAQKTLGHASKPKR